MYVCVYVCVYVCMYVCVCVRLRCVCSVFLPTYLSKAELYERAFLFHWLLNNNNNYHLLTICYEYLFTVGQFQG